MKFFDHIIGMRRSILLWLFCFLLSLLVTPAGLSAEKTNSIIIQGINIEGNVRTEREAILDALKIRRGMRFEMNEDELREYLFQELNNLQFFFKLKVLVEVRASKAYITLKLKDKWTLFPIPMLSVYENRWTFGLGLLESNFLGRPLV